MKVLFVDIDGTLVDYENRLPQSAAKAIRKTREKGNKVYVCTGRSEAEIYDYIWAIGLDGMIGGNGAYVKDGKEVLMHRMLTREQCGRAVAWCTSRGLPLYLESNSGLYGSPDFREGALPAMQEYAGRKGRNRHMTMDEFFPGLIMGGNLDREDVNKISFVLHSHEDYLAAQRDFPDLQVGYWGGVEDKALFGDLGVKNITKKAAVEVLLEHLQVKREDTFAFGDADVDIPLFEACGTSIAMGSGTSACRQAADYVTAAVDQDGLYLAFEHFDLV